MAFDSIEAAEQNCRHSLRTDTKGEKNEEYIQAAVVSDDRNRMRGGGNFVAGDRGGFYKIL